MSLIALSKYSITLYILKYGMASTILFHKKKEMPEKNNDK